MADVIYPCDTSTINHTIYHTIYHTSNIAQSIGLPRCSKGLKLVMLVMSAVVMLVMLVMSALVMLVMSAVVMLAAQQAAQYVGSPCW